MKDKSVNKGWIDEYSEYNNEPFMNGNGLCLSIKFSSKYECTVQQLRVSETPGKIVKQFHIMSKLKGDLGLKLRG